MVYRARFLEGKGAVLVQDFRGDFVRNQFIVNF